MGTQTSAGQFQKKSHEEELKKSLLKNITIFFFLDKADVGYPLEHAKT